IYIDGFPYEIKLDTNHFKDTVVARDWTTHMGDFPNSLANSTDSITFYYARAEWNRTDSIKWRVTADDSGKLRVLSTPFRVRGTDTSWFSKAYQPNTIVLTVDTIFGKIDTIGCHWEYTLNNSGDTGRLLLDVPLDTSDLPSNV